jgi:chaperone protein EcpD
MHRNICIFLILVCQWTWALAGIALDSTRLVYLSTAKSVDLTLSNMLPGASRYLAWVDDGDPATLPENASADFFVFPASGMLLQGRKQTVRLMFNGAKRPTDREAVYFLNVLELPQKATPKEGQGAIAIANRTRIKIFMRPADLTADPADSAKKLVWEAQAASDAPVFRAKNASPYFVSMRSVKLMQGGTELTDLGISMVPPWGELEFRVDSQRADWAGATAVKYVYVNDYGGNDEVTFTLPPR